MRISSAGVVEQIIVEGNPAGYEYIFASDDGRRYRLSDSKSLAKFAGRRVSLTGILKSGRLKVAGEIKGSEENKPNALPPPTFGRRKVLMLLVNFSNNQSQPLTTDFARSRIFTDPISTNQYFKEASLYRYELTGIQRPDGDVVGWLTLPFSSDNCGAEVYSGWVEGADALARQNGYEPNNYNSVIYVFPTLCISPSATVGFLGGAARQRVWLHASDLYSFNITTHELGHNLGLNHAQSFVCNGTNIPTDCQSVNYGDEFDVMARSPFFFFNNYFRYCLGWMTGRNQIVTESGDYRLFSPNTPSKGNQILQIPLKDAQGFPTAFSFFLEFRRPYSFDNQTQYPVFQPLYNGVTIRYAPSEPNAGFSHLIDATPQTVTFSDAPLTVGNSFTDTEHGVTITTLGTNPIIGARVRIHLTR